MRFPCQGEGRLAAGSRRGRHNASSSTPGPPMKTLSLFRSAAAVSLSCILLPVGAQSGAASASASAAGKQPGAVVTPSGLVYRVIKEGQRPSPAASDRVKVHYRDTLSDGKEFYSSYARNEPATFPLDRVIKCWTEGVQRMKVGGKSELVCPLSIAYGERGAGGVIPPNATLRFEVELLAIEGR